MALDLTIRPLESTADLDACVALQRATWGTDIREVVPHALLTVVQKVGGIALGAFDASGGLMGFVFGVSGIRDGRRAHWSHMLAVREDCRDRGIGRRLKFAQRERLRALAVERMYWTFDPLVARNAHLNLNRLGASVREYVRDMYGNDPESTIDAVIGTDRFIVEWPLDTEPTPRPLADLPRDTPLVTIDAAAVELPIAAVVGVAVPDDVHRLKREDPDLARRWRTMTRSAFTEYLGRGYSVVGFASAGGAPAYVLTRDANDV